MPVHALAVGVLLTTALFDCCVFLGCCQYQTNTLDPVTSASLIHEIHFEEAPWGNSHTRRAVATLGAFQTITSALIVAAFFRSFGPLIVQGKWRARVLKIRCVGGRV